MTKEELKQKAIDSEKNWFDKDITISDLLIEFATETTKELQEEITELKGEANSVKDWMYQQREQNELGVDYFSYQGYHPPRKID